MQPQQQTQPTRSCLNHLAILFALGFLLESACGFSPPPLSGATDRGGRATAVPAIREAGAAEAAAPGRHAHDGPPVVTTYARRRAAATRVFDSRSEAGPSPAPRRALPRTGLAQGVLDWALASPLWKHVLVPQARANIVRTAEANQIPWTSATAWIRSQMPPASSDPFEGGGGGAGGCPPPVVPDYYRKAFHAYDEGNLSWDAAYEVELASCAVGARNFPQYGSRGEDAFRGAFEGALGEAGARVPARTGDVDVGDGPTERILIADFGCGTGMSTRRLARRYPHVDAIFGVDLSPYFIAVGRRLLELAPASFHDGGPWVTTVHPDERIQYLVGDVSGTLTQVPQLQEGSMDVVNVQFVLHELPPEAARNVIDEACRLLKPQGQLWICEMDFESPAYAAQRANPLLFSLIRSTEPYLDEYAESISSLFAYIEENFQHVTVVPATGRHFALVATGPSIGTDGSGEASKKGRIDDLRFDEHGNYRVEDTHLKLWESSQSEARHPRESG